MDSWYFERQARLALKCNEHGFGGIINAGAIEKPGGLYNAVLVTLAHYYREGDQDVRSRIDSLINEAEFFKDKKAEENTDKAKYIFNEIRDLRINEFNEDNKL